MAAIKALREALSALGRNPVLFLGGLLYSLVTLPQTTTQLAGLPVVPTVLQILTFFATPFVVAGLLGMAAEALDGEASLSSLPRVGKARYVPLLLGNLVQFVIFVAFGVVAAVVGLLVGVGVLGVGGAGAGSAVVVGLLAVALFLAFVVVAFLIQFYPVAIVVDEADALEGFRESYRLVRDNVVSALGYSLINVLVGVVTALPVTGFVLWRTLRNLPPLGEGGAPTAPGPVGAQALNFSTSEIVLVSAAFVVTTTLLLTFQQTFATAFYRLHESRAKPSDFSDLGEYEGEESTL